MPSAAEESRKSRRFLVGRPDSGELDYRTGPENESGGPEATAWRLLDPVSPAIHGLHGMRASCPHFTPCMSFWMSGAIRNRNTPEPTSTQKPKV